MTGKIVVLTGGVGGAKLVEGLAAICAPQNLTAIVNTGDDFTHFGLHVAPDIDTLLYTLAGKSDRQKGWGRAKESWSFMSALRELDGEDWFALGDGDLALHVLRSHRMAGGALLSRVTRDFARAWGLSLEVLPMSDLPVATVLQTDAGTLEFQRYFVQHRCEPKVLSISFRGSERNEPAAGVLDAIEAADHILIAPSNPYLSIDPILALPAIRAALAHARGPVVAVSPIVDGKAVKGPTAKLMQELGVAVDNSAIANHYRGLLSGLLVHETDDGPTDLPWARTDTVMHTIEDKCRVAQAALALSQDLAA
jgi:LPPG:FO 2-phospho-L-lactate transferase